MGNESRVEQDTRNISSPEQLNDYLKVTNPKIWMLLVAVVLIIVGFLLWSGFTTLESYATGTGIATGGEITVHFDDPAKASNVTEGMEMEVGGVKCDILTVGVDSDGDIVAWAMANIPDGAYDVRVGYKSEQVISMLLN